ncbi:MAG: biotin--[acetyl-CoA-carboxylase] ligase [Bacillota bacterium]
MRDQILKILRQSKEDISGQLLSQKLNISRAAIGKHIKSLRQQGYIIEASTHKGYRFVSAPDQLFASEIESFLLADSPWKIYWKKQVDSTNNVLRQMAQENAPSFTALVAEEQSAGKGRLGRCWHSPAGAGIWLSILLRPELASNMAQFFTLTIAVAIAEALSGLGWPIFIKWPNDLLLNGKKVCGILAEIQADMDTLHWVVVGMGINYHHCTLPTDIKDLAISLNTIKATYYSRAEITAKILSSIEKYYHMLCQKGFRPIREKWLQYACCIGKNITANTLSGSYEGKSLDMDDHGYLILQLSDGSTKKINAGDIIIKT